MSTSSRARTNTAVGYRRNLPVSDPECLVTEEVAVPEPGPHDLLVEVEAVSVNPVDVRTRAHTPAEGLRVLGFDAAGTVRDVGSAVTLFRPGDEVYYAGTIDRPGTNQRLHAVDERLVGRRPRGLSFADAAALPLTAITAWESLFDRLALRPDSAGTILVVGASGGVGAITLRLLEARCPDVTVIATASDAERQAWVRELGAEHAVNHRTDLAAQVLAVAPDGVDWLFTAHSEGQLETYAEIVRPFGRVVAIDDGPRDVSPLKSRSISWHWEFMFTRALLRTPDRIEQHRLLNRVADLVDEGRLHPTTTRALTPLNAANLREANRLVETGRSLGKTVVHGWE